MLLCPCLKHAWRQQCDTAHTSLIYVFAVNLHRRFISLLLMGLTFARFLNGHMVLVIHREKLIAYSFPLVHIVPLGYKLCFTCFHFDMHKIIRCLLS